MKNLDVKFRRIFIPFLIMSACCTVFYSLLRWLFFIKSNVVTIDQEILDFWAPFTFPLIPILIWLRPRVKLLNLKGKRSKADPLSAYMFVAWVAMAVPSVIAQSYLETAAGKLTKLQRISQIDSLPRTKFYTIKNFYPDRQLAKLEPRFKTSGKYNENFDMYLFGVVPLYNSIKTIKVRVPVYKSEYHPNNNQTSLVFKGALVPDDSLSRPGLRALKKVNSVNDTMQVVRDGNIALTPYAWLAIRYEETISNHLPQDEKEEKYKQFAEKSEDDFNVKSFDKFDYLDRAPYNWDLKGYQAAISLEQFSQLQTPRNILLPVYEPFEARNGSKLPWIFGSFGIGATVFLIALFFKPLRREAAIVDLVEEQQKDKKSALTWLKAIIVPQQRLLVTQLLIQLNLVLFIIMVLSGLGLVSFEARDLLKWGGNYRPYVNEGQYWRLLTNIFLHGGIMHVLMNMYGLFFAGLFLEPIMGRGKYLVTYFVCGIMASIASVWWHPATVSVGASGAIFGLFGALFALASVNVLGVGSRKPILINVGIFVGYNLLFGLAGGIDNAAHIGGLLSGVVLGYAFYPFIEKKEPPKRRGHKTQNIIDKEPVAGNVPSNDH